MTKSKFEHLVASDMDSILRSKHFEDLFGKALSKQAAEEDAQCAHDCGESHDHHHVHDDSCADDGTDGKLEEKQATLAQVISSLMKVSEVLDEAGLEKTAELSLNLANQIIVEAKKKAKPAAPKPEDKKGKEKGKDGKDKKDDKKMKDEKKGKEDKSDKKSDPKKKGSPFELFKKK